MNKYLSKPVQPDDIEALLVARFGARAAGAHPAPAFSKTAEVPVPPPTQPPSPDRPAGSLSSHPFSGAPGNRRRFRASDVAQHLDMAVIGDICVGVSLAGYRTVVTGFLDDAGASMAALLAALDKADTLRVPALAHAVKGSAASMGLRSIQNLCTGIEADGASFGPPRCQAAAAALRDLAATAHGLLHRMGFL